MPDPYRQPSIPEGIDDSASEHPTWGPLWKLVNERWSNLPIERVLVWHLESVVADALPHLADALGINGPEFGSAPPRSFLRKGIELRRKRGTAGTTEFVLGVIGYEDAEIIERTDQSFLYDDTWSYDGTITYGGDAHWAKFFVRVEVATLPSVDELLLLWDTIIKWKRKVTFPILIIAVTP